MAFLSDPHAHAPRAPANPRLLKALACCAGDDAAALNGMYEALLNSTLVVPTCTAEPAAPRRRTPATFLLIEDEQGRPSVPVFTDLQALQRWLPGSVSFASLPTHLLLRDALPPTASGLWVNVADRDARFVSRAELSRVTGGLIGPTYAAQVERELTPAHAEFAPRPPSASLPADLVARVADLLRREPDVTLGFLIELDPKPKRRRLALGVRLGRLLDEPLVDALLRRVAVALNTDRPHRRGGIEVVLLDYKRYAETAAKVAPVYERT